MPRFKLEIEYEGTRYSGWQVQKHARTVQGELIEAVKRVLPEQEIDLQGAGRTDAGVHALRQVAHLDCETRIPPDILRLKLNDELPADIHILSLQPVPKSFHARHSAIARSYIYQISRRRTAFGKRFVWWIKDELSLEAMQQAAALFSGMKNFESFTAERDEDKSTLVLMHPIEVKACGDLILLRFFGSHFLWKMVRQSVGVIAEVGRGKLSLSEVREFFEKKSDRPAQLTAPPSGLFFEGAYYRKTERPGPLKPALTLAFETKGEETKIPLQGETQHTEVESLRKTEK
ncbi:MAG: tRNA pseudouridine(38-40) synthase TruA [Chloroherpetonaceae bacterium]|nr:tRNA pseudouridine(38-40) synthase TruA [Chloroherpetonaceae bacterium]